MEKFLLFKIPNADTELPKFLAMGGGGAAVFTAIFIYANFIMKWATDRMKDWEAAKDPKAGAPALVCWLAGVGELTACLIGAHLFAWFYLARKGKLYAWHIPMLAGGAVTLLWLWIILIRWLRWYRRHRGALAPLTEAMSNEPVHWHPPLRWTVPLFIVTGIGALLECFFGDFVAGLMGLFYELIAAFGIGAYCALRGDLLLRAVVAPPKNLPATAPPNNALKPSAAPPLET